MRWALLHAADGAGWALVGINAVGCLILGMVVHGALRADDRRRLALGVGFCGALTTFSILALDTARHLDSGSPLDAAALLLISLVTGVVALVAGAATRRAGA